MLRRIIALVAVLALTLAGVATAAKKPKPKSSHGAIHAHITSQKGKILFVSGDYSEQGGGIGSGAIIYRTKATPNAKGDIDVDAKVTIYTKKGSLSGPATAVQHIGPKTSTVSGGKYNLTKGTGAYKGWATKGTFNGTQAEDGTYTFRFKGKVTK